VMLVLAAQVPAKHALLQLPPVIHAKAVISTTQLKIPAHNVDLPTHFVKLVLPSLHVPPVMMDTQTSLVSVQQPPLDAKIRPKLLLLVPPDVLMVTSTMPLPRPVLLVPHLAQLVLLLSSALAVRHHKLLTSLLIILVPRLPTANYIRIMLASYVIPDLLTLVEFVPHVLPQVAQLRLAPPKICILQALLPAAVELVLPLILWELQS